MIDPDTRVSLGEAAYRQLHADVIALRLVPGQRLTERELVRDTGFGVSPVREALTRLDHDGLVRTLPRKGYLVTSLTPRVIDDLFVVWRIVGPEMVRLGLEKATHTEREELRGALTRTVRTERAAGRDALMAQIASAREIFEILCGASANSYLMYLFHRISGDLERVWALISIENRNNPAAVLDSVDSWLGERLLNLAPEQAATATAAYIAETHERVLEIITSRASVMETEVIPLRSTESDH